MLVMSVYNIKQVSASEYSPNRKLYGLKSNSEKCSTDNVANQLLSSTEKLTSGDGIFDYDLYNNYTMYSDQIRSSERKKSKRSFAVSGNTNNTHIARKKQKLKSSARKNRLTYPKYKFKETVNNKKSLKKKKNFRKLLKYLRFRRKKKKQELHMKVKFDQHLQKYSSKTYLKQERLTAKEVSIKATLNYLEGFTYYAFRSRNSQLIEELLSMYHKLSEYYKNESRILIQKADIHIILYYLSQSYRHFEQSLHTLNAMIANPDVSEKYFKAAAKRAVFILEENGAFSRAIDIQIKMAQKIRNDVDILMKLGDMFRHANKYSEAKLIFERVIEINPNDVGAKVLLGNVCYRELINKKNIVSKEITNGFSFSNLNDCISLMKNVMETNDKNIRRSYLFYTYGDALRRLGRAEESNMIFGKAVDEGLFPSFWQRTNHFVTSLRSKPFWTLKETKISQILNEISRNWKVVRKEAMQNFNQRLFSKHPEELRDTGSWSTFSLYEFAKRNTKNCMRAPITCSLIENVPQIADNTKGIVIFSMMEAGTHIHPHVGSSNCRLRVHLGLDIPETDESSTVDSKSYSILRVGNEYKSWKNGEMFVWDDSFDHEVWHYHPLNHTRLILIVDVLHPDLTEYQIATL